MNKETFLKELSERLHVLNEKERQDLLDEYAQHIDMKITNGLSEEEAVKDFGTPEELCAELLDVYHINSEYASGSAVHVQNAKKKLLESISIPGLKKETESTPEKTEEQSAQELEEKRLQEEEKKAREEERRVQSAQRKEEQRAKFAQWNDERRARAAQKKAERSEKSAKWREEYRLKYSEWKESRRAKRQAKRIMRKEKYAKMHEQYQQKKLERQAYRMEHGGSWFGRLCAGIWNIIVLLTILCWKCCLFFAAAPVIFIGLCALFCTGTVAVLMQQGYPLTGITLIGAGVFLASAGVSGLILSYVFNGRRNIQKGDK